MRTVVFGAGKSGWRRGSAPGARGACRDHRCAARERVDPRRSIGPARRMRLRQPPGEPAPRNDGDRPEPSSRGGPDSRGGRQARIRVVGDIELFARALHAAAEVVAITGSNGKTTMTALPARLARAAGSRRRRRQHWRSPARRDSGGQCVAGLYVIELSSFQLETTYPLAPVAATVLNITENHLDRYATLDDYATAKARIFAHGGIQVLNRDDPRSLAMRREGMLVQTFGAGVPRIRGGLGARRPWPGGRWGVARTRRSAAPAGGGPDARGAAQRAERARRARARLFGREDRPRRPCGAFCVRSPAAPDAADRGRRWRRVHRRLEGHDGRRDPGRARRPRSPRRADRRRRWQGTGLCGPPRERRGAMPSGAPDRPRRAGAGARARRDARGGRSAAERWMRPWCARSRSRGMATWCCYRPPARA